MTNVSRDSKDLKKNFVKIAPLVKLKRVEQTPSSGRCNFRLLAEKIFLAKKENHCSQNGEKWTLRCGACEIFKESQMEPTKKTEKIVVKGRNGLVDGEILWARANTFWGGGEGRGAYATGMKIVSVFIASPVSSPLGVHVRVCVNKIAELWTEEFQELGIAVSCRIHRSVKQVECYV